MSPLKINPEAGVDISRYTIDKSSKGLDSLKFPLVLGPEEKLILNDLTSLVKIILTSSTKSSFGGYVNGLLVRIGKKAEVNGLIIEGVETKE